MRKHGMVFCKKKKKILITPHLPISESLFVLLYYYLYTQNSTSSLEYFKYIIKSKIFFLNIITLY